MEAELLKDVLHNIGLHEGRVLAMYRDTKGIVTCGVGHALFTPVDASNVFWWKESDILATRNDVTRAYAAVKAGSIKRSLLMSYEESDRLLTADLAKFEHVLNAEFPELSTYPHFAQVAMFDIAFQCGSLAHWPALTAAIKERNWTVAANESHRPDASESRNQDTFEQLALR